MLYTKKLAVQELETEESLEKVMSFASPDTESCHNVPLRGNQLRREHRLHREDVAASIRMSLRQSHLVGPEDEVFQQFILDRLAEADEDSHVPPFDTLKTYAFEGTGSVMGSLSSLESSTFDPCVSQGHILRLSPWQGELEDETSF